MKHKKINDIECFLLDMDGTIYLENTLLPEVLETITFIKEKGKNICFLTNNSSVSHIDYISKLSKLGINISKNEIYTSGMATCEYLLKNHKNKEVLLLGTLKLQTEFKEYGINLTEKNPDIVVIGFDTSLTYENLSKVCKYIRDGAYYIATHPDLNCPMKEGYIPDVGSFIALIEASTNRKPDIICGKPYTPIAEGIKQRFNLPSSKIAMVGDRLSTDIMFAINNDFLGILVMTGETNQPLLEASSIKPDVVLPSMVEIRDYIV